MTISPPWLLSRPPYKAQSIAMNKAYGKRGWGHFLEQGIGKTAVALNECWVYHRHFDYDTFIVLSPNKFKDGWKAEADLNEFPIPIHIFESDSREAARKFLSKEPVRMIVVNHEALVYEATRDILKPIVGPRTMLIIDESIACKNPKAILTRETMALAHKCGAVRILTGKPLTQGPHDLWAQFRILGELEGFNYYAFKTVFCRKGGYMGKKIVGVREENQSWLQNIMDKSSWTARKVDYTDLPEKIWPHPRRLSMTDRQIKAYKQMEEEFIVELQDGVLTADQVITRNMKLQQITSGFIYDEHGVAQYLVPIDKNPKINEIKSILAEEIDSKLIVVAWYKESIRMLMQALAEYNPAVIRGTWPKDPAPDTESEKARFNLDPECRVIVCQEKSAKFGHTLIGSQINGDPSHPCYTTAFFENSYSLDDRSQIEDRNHRNGQKFPVTYIDFFASGMDLAALKALQAKEDIASAVMRYARETGTLPTK